MQYKYHMYQKTFKSIMTVKSKSPIKFKNINLNKTSEAQKQLFNNDINMYNTFSYYYFKKK